MERFLHRGQHGSADGGRQFLCLLPDPVAGPFRGQMHPRLHPGGRRHHALFRPQFQRAGNGRHDGQCLQHPVFRSLRFLLLGPGGLHPGPGRPALHLPLCPESGLRRGEESPGTHRHRPRRGGPAGIRQHHQLALDGPERYPAGQHAHAVVLYREHLPLFQRRTPPQRQRDSAGGSGGHFQEPRCVRAHHRGIGPARPFLPVRIRPGDQRLHRPGQRIGPARKFIGHLYGRGRKMHPAAAGHQGTVRNSPQLPVPERRRCNVAHQQLGRAAGTHRKVLEKGRSQGDASRGR